MQEMQKMRVWALGKENPMEEEIGNPLQYSYLKISMDREAGWLQPMGSQKSDMT